MKTYYVKEAHGYIEHAANLVSAARVSIRRAGNHNGSAGGSGSHGVAELTEAHIKLTQALKRCKVELALRVGK